MPISALKLAEYVAELEDNSLFISEFRLHQIAKACELDISRVRSSELAAAFHQVAGLTYLRLIPSSRAAAEKAIDHFRVAARVDSQNPLYANNIAVCLSDLGRFQEALEVVENALRDLPAAKSWTRLYAAASRALARLGRWREANEMFGKACDSANHDAPADLFMLASHAAEINDDVFAAVFAAQFLSVKFGNHSPVINPVTFIEESPREWWTGLMIPPVLAASLSRIAEDPVGRALAAAPTDDEPLSEREEAAIGRPSRDRLTAAEVRARLYPS